MRRVKTAQMQTKVYLCTDEISAERAFRYSLSKTSLGGNVFRWTGLMGSIDKGTERTYFMTDEHFNKWKETHSNYKVIRLKIKGGESDE